MPLQSICCGAKFAIRSITGALRSELIRDKLNVRLTTVDLPAVNTPQFDWALNKIGPKAKPEAPARAICLAAALFQAVPGEYGAHGRFDCTSRNWQLGDF